jgi:hypothetical protein
MDELNDIFETLAGSPAGIVPSNVVANGPGIVAQVAGTVPSSAESSARGTALQATGAVASTAAGSVLGTTMHEVASPNPETGIGTTLETVGMDVLKSGFGLVPIIGSLLSLFGGGDSQPMPTLTKYQMPESIDYQAAEVGRQIENADYGQSGTPRAFGGGTGAGALPGITVNVQAMDARSFLDRSSDIAAAVKDAMLNLNSINDVVNDL